MCQCGWCRRELDPLKALWEDGKAYCDIICAESDQLGDDDEHEKGIDGSTLD